MTDAEEFGQLESATSNDIISLKERIALLEKRENELMEEIKQNENDFGQKRAKFKEIYLQKEEELKKEKEAVTKAKEEVKDLKLKVENLNSELQGIKAAVELSETSKQDEIENLRRDCQQEVASLQRLMSEVADEATRTTMLRFENERNKLKELNESYEEEVRELRSRLSQEREGFLQSVANKLKAVGSGQPSPPYTPRTAVSVEHENLEASMRKAKEDADVLKSVVLPLEDEIQTLKSQLSEAQEKIHELESQASVDDMVTPGHKQHTPDSQSLPDLDRDVDPEERIKELLNYLRIEKASRKDLEMYVAVLSTQKNILEEDRDKLRTDLEDVCTVLDEEKRAHEELEQTWQMANDQFLESQRLMMMDLRRMESVLSTEQQRQIGELQKKDLEREAQEKKVKDLEEMRLKQEEKRKIDALKKVEEASKRTKEKEAKVRAAMQKSQSQEIKRGSENLSEDLLFNSSQTDSPMKLSLSAPEVLNESGDGDSILDSVVGTSQSETEVDGMRIQISPEKVLNLPLLSEAQSKALTDPTPETEARKSLLASVKVKNERISKEGRRIVSEKEWDLLQQQLKNAREKLGRPCDMCNNYEAQLQSVQDEYKNEQVKAKSLERQLQSEKQLAENRQKYVDDLEDSLKNSAEEAEKQISSLVNRVQECEKYLAELRDQHSQSQQELQNEQKRLTESREEVQKELTRLQQENDSLIGKHSKYAQQLQNEDINLPNNLEEMQLLLLKYREEIIQAKVAKEHTEDSLKSEILFLKDQVVSEQQERNTLEETLTQEINTLQEKLVVQDSLKSELERESTVRSDTEAKLRETDQSLKSIQAKSKQLIHALQQQVEEQSNARTKLENEVQKLKGKVTSLQIDLDNSEAVQRDFVKLSQSLQIQLEKIRQAENEVRWQHEDDVEECNNCKQSFTVTKRKHHCRHCGKIFCSDCTSKIVTSGPHMRQSRVCDICHTILVKDAMPYFSTEPPNTPD